MKLLLIALGFILTSCAALPELFTAAEQVLTDDAIEITIKVDKEAITPNTNVNLDVKLDVTNPQISKSPS